MLTVTFSNSKHQLRFKAALRIDALSMPPAITYQRVRRAAARSPQQTGAPRLHARARSEVRCSQATHPANVIAPHLTDLPLAARARRHTASPRRWTWSYALPASRMAASQTALSRRWRRLSASRSSASRPSARPCSRRLTRHARRSRSDLSLSGWLQRLCAFALRPRIRDWRASRDGPTAQPQAHVAELHGERDDWSAPASEAACGASRGAKLPARLVARRGRGLARTVGRDSAGRHHATQTDLSGLHGSGRRRTRHIYMCRNGSAVGCDEQLSQRSAAARERTSRDWSEVAKKEKEKSNGLWRRRAERQGPARRAEAPRRS